MIPAALIGFSVGSLIGWWVILRSFSHGESDFAPDPLDEVQPIDPRILLTFPTSTSNPKGVTVTRTFGIDCE